MDQTWTLSTSLLTVAAIAVMFVGSSVLIVLPEVSASIHPCEDRLTQNDNACRARILPPCEDRLSQNDNVCRAR